MTQRKVVVFSGYTAAGKTTHARLLADRLDVPVFSASRYLSRLAHDRGFESRWGDRWSPEIDEARRGSTIDEEVDRYMTDAARHAAGGVFDGCFLPWLYRGSDVVHLWLDSDEDSRVRKCQISHIESEILDPAEARRIVRAKDEFSRATLRRTSGAEFKLDPDRFHIVLSNTDLIPTATSSAAERGIATLEPIVFEAVAFALGLIDAVPASPHLLSLRRIN